jgi:putative transcriptional regulator
LESSTRWRLGIKLVRIPTFSDGYYGSYSMQSDFNNPIMSDSIRGKFLIAGKHLRDNNFFKSIVLMLEHNDEGAMGLVINRPLDVSLSEALSKHFDFPASDHYLYDGGPVEQNALLILHNSTDHDQEHVAVVPGVFVGTSPDIFERVVQSISEDDASFRFRIFAGYSGWSAGQLESEMARGDWYAVKAKSQHVFGDDPYEVWEDVMQSFYESHRILPNQPPSPEWN